MYEFESFIYSYKQGDLREGETKITNEKIDKTKIKSQEKVQMYYFIIFIHVFDKFFIKILIKTLNRS